MALTLQIFPRPPWGHLADNRLALIDVDMLNENFLLALAPVLLKGFDLRGIRLGKFRGQCLRQRRRA
jgi:hypothetical protein